MKLVRYVTLSFLALSQIDGLFRGADRASLENEASVKAILANSKSANRFLMKCANETVTIELKNGI